MTETSRETTQPIARTRRQALLTLVREGCEMLHSAHPSVVESLSLSRTLDDEDAARLVGRMARHVAEEYDMIADVTTNGRAMNIRLGRDRRFVRLRRSPDARRAAP